MPRAAPTRPVDHDGRGGRACQKRQHRDQRPLDQIHLAQGQVVGYLGHQARHVRGVLADRQKAPRIDSAGIEGQEQTQVDVGAQGSFRRGQGPQVRNGHGLSKLPLKLTSSLNCARSRVQTDMADPFLHTIPAWRWALIQTRRDLRATSMRVLLVAVTLAVAALTAVAFFADRIERGLSRDAAQLLGGDVVVVGDQPLSADFARRAQAERLRTARTASFPSMARAPDEQGGEARLSSLKAVSETYPLRGQLTLGDVATDGTVQPRGLAPAGGPRAGEVWVDPGLLPALNLKMGDAIWLGEASFRISAVDRKS